MCGAVIFKKKLCVSYIRPDSLILEYIYEKILTFFRSLLILQYLCLNLDKSGELNLEKTSNESYHLLPLGEIGKK